ncbi:MAG: hypothetical protein HYV60_02480 [Planctomycetia bacterium]|nr:hypothetical protein [Planctomycetia bacterium]
MSKQRDRKRRKRTAGKARAQRVLRDTRNPNQTLEAFSAVFGEHAEEFLRMASEGASPEEIAAKLYVPVALVNKFVDSFTKLPGGIDKHLLRAPSLLSKQGNVQSLLKSAIREARHERRRRPW